MKETIYDGFTEVTFPRLDLDESGAVSVPLHLRCGYALVKPLKAAGDSGISAPSKSGLVSVKQDGIPSMYALILAVSPYHVPDGADPSINNVLPKAGDIVLKVDLYAGEPLDAPSILGEDEAAKIMSLAPMERSVRGLLLLRLTDIAAIEMV